MSKSTKEEQTEIVRWALNFMVAIESEQKELDRLKKEKYPSPPSAPRRKVINQKVDPVKPDYSALPKINYSFSNYLINKMNQIQV